MSLRQYLGIHQNRVSATEIAVATVSGGLGIGLVVLSAMLFKAQWPLLINSAVLIPIAATAVLVFAVPHGALSQPWPVIAGNTLSAVVGVLCYSVFSDSLVSMALALGVSVLIMNLCRCLHPPGGATALSAVAGGDVITASGFEFVLFPVLFCSVTIVVMAVLLNLPFRWRWYPAHWFHINKKLEKVPARERGTELTSEDFLLAVQQHNSFIDITEDSWVELLEQAKLNAESNLQHPEHVRRNAFYSNGKLGKQWQIRQVVQLRSSRESADSGKHAIEQVVYRVLENNQPGPEHTQSVPEFLQWARFEVVFEDNCWKKAHQ
ncbi:HPP family protein [Salinimonas marina]|uniref:HPP family protein n=1 Tax=Salinimonas marina TaxID=2785918 RepID=A0A7S9DV19_9ALTE|nr:HPP family protein [Salinimonas marina]QPG04449.1 HPP family protein [Salinimonas marina]